MTPRASIPFPLPHKVALFFEIVEGDCSCQSPSRLELLSICGTVVLVVITELRTSAHPVSGAYRFAY